MRDGQKQGHGARVVVGARLDLAADHAAVIVVRDEDDPVRLRVARAIDRADVDREGPRVATVRIGGLLEPVTEERREAGRFQAGDDVRAGAGIALGAAKPPPELGGREIADVRLERGAVDTRGDLVGVRRHARRPGGREGLVDELVGHEHGRSGSTPGEEHSGAGHERRDPAPAP